MNVLKSITLCILFFTYTNTQKMYRTFFFKHYRHLTDLKKEIISQSFFYRKVENKINTCRSIHNGLNVNLIFFFFIFQQKIHKCKYNLIKTLNIKEILYTPRFFLDWCNVHVYTTRIYTLIVGFFLMSQTVFFNSCFYQNSVHVFGI